MKKVIAAIFLLSVLLSSCSRITILPTYDGYHKDHDMPNKLNQDLKE